MYQFLIHPDAVDNTMLVTRAWGVPLTAINEYSDVNPTREFMQDIRKKPDSIIKYISSHSDAFKETSTSWRSLALKRSCKVEITIDPITHNPIEKISFSYNNTLPSVPAKDYPLADVTLPRAQGRLIVDPQATMDAQKFTIKKHYWDQVNEEYLAKYKNVVDSFANWIMEQQITYKIDEIKEIIEGLSDPISPWTMNPYTGEEYPDREEALILLRQELFHLSKELSQLYPS